MSSNNGEVKKVFISYSQGFDEHTDNVFDLVQKLRTDGVDCSSDHKYKTNPPPQGWDLWMKEEIDNADFVLMICSENYRRRAEGKEETGTGMGVKWEGAIIRQFIYQNDSLNTRFIPVLFSKKPIFELSRDEIRKLYEHIPFYVTNTNRYIVNISNFDSCKGYENLFRHITGQDEYIPEPIANETRKLPPRNKKK